MNYNQGFRVLLNWCQVKILIWEYSTYNNLIKIQDSVSGTLIGIFVQYLFEFVNRFSNISSLLHTLSQYSPKICNRSLINIFIYYICVTQYKNNKRCLLPSITSDWSSLIYCLEVWSTVLSRYSISEQVSQFTCFDTPKKRSYPRVN